MKYLYFSAPWCGPCRQYGPVMERVGQTVPVQKVNVDENQQLAMEYSVRSVPTVICSPCRSKRWSTISRTI
jgi:thioredoxin-like negative regulator of GroEL